MKTLVLLFMLSLWAQVNSQNYKPLIDDLNEWHFTTCFFGCSQDVYYTDGDTTYNSTQYKVLNGYHYISRTFWLREDTVTQQVFLSYDSGGLREEVLLYDFSLLPGDSIEMKNPSSPFPSNAGFFVVDSIVMVQLHDNNYYRHFYLSATPSNPISSNQSQWMEGVGSLSMINAPSGTPDVNGTGKLSCFFKNGELFYSQIDSIANCVPIYTSVTDNKLIGNGIKVFPTIVQNACHITGIASMESLFIYDINGKIIIKKNIDNRSNITISTTDFNSGIYFIVLTDHKQKRASFKLIKK
jgi:hypothetical protein